jgi:MFS-type transporter involved in bile tolerance (Atg22 family)
MVLAIFVVYGTRTLHLDSARYGLFVAFASLAGVAGAFSAGTIVRRFGAARVILGGLGAATISYIGLGFTHMALLALFVFGLQEIGTAVASVGSITTRQRLIPQQLYGRVGGVYRLLVLVVAPAGALFGGFVADATGAPATMLMAGGLELVMLGLLGPALFHGLVSIRED